MLKTEKTTTKSGLNLVDPYPWLFKSIFGDKMLKQAVPGNAQPGKPKTKIINKIR